MGCVDAPSEGLVLLVEQICEKVAWPAAAFDFAAFGTAVFDVGSAAGEQLEVVDKADGGRDPGEHQQVVADDGQAGKDAA